MVNVQFRGPEELIEFEELTSELNKVMTTLTPREETVLCLNFGLHGEDRQNLEQIAQKFCVNRERIRGIKEKALRKLRHSSRSEKLRTLLKNIDFDPIS